MHIPPSGICFPSCHLGSLYRAQLLGPSLCWLDFSDCAELVRGVTGHADVVIAFEDELDVAELKGR